MSSNRQVAPERTGWRDQALSERHRNWGWDCPAVDLDFLLLEYDNARAVAIVEYKFESAPTQRTAHLSSSYEAIVELGTNHKRSLPVFGVRYADGFSWFIVTALNESAKRHLGELQKRMSEYEYVAFLYKIRGQTLSKGSFESTCGPSASLSRR